jgi:hypothetical protein
MSQRPKNLHPSRSFTRIDAAPKSPLSRSRASTLQGLQRPDMLDPLKTNMVPEEDESVHGDVFAKPEDEDTVGSPEPKTPDTFEELPIEIRSLTERYRLSLYARFVRGLTLQVPRVPHCQSTPHSAVHRQPQRSLPRLLHPSLGEDRYPHSHSVSAPQQRCISV